MIDPIVLSIAKTAILSQFDTNITIDTKALLKHHPFLAQEGASFVTLKKSGELRGCIGSIVAYRTLLDDLIANAKAAAFHDPRFQALHLEETQEEFFLEVSLLSKAVLLEYEDIADLIEKIKPFEDGLILKYGPYQGTFLPQVWEQLPTPEAFLEHLSYKAGADATIYSKHPDIYRYKVEHIQDKWDAILPL
jgi:AmmeMemoRadiSam system protein A